MSDKGRRDSKDKKTGERQGVGNDHPEHHHHDREGVHHHDRNPRSGHATRVSLDGYPAVHHEHHEIHDAGQNHDHRRHSEDHENHRHSDDHQDHRHSVDHQYHRHSQDQQHARHSEDHNDHQRHRYSANHQVHEHSGGQEHYRHSVDHQPHRHSEGHQPHRHSDSEDHQPHPNSEDQYHGHPHYLQDHRQSDDHHPGGHSDDHLHHRHSEESHHFEALHPTPQDHQHHPAEQSLHNHSEDQHYQSGALYYHSGDLRHHSEDQHYHSGDLHHYSQDQHHHSDDHNHQPQGVPLHSDDHQANIGDDHPERHELHAHDPTPTGGHHTEERKRVDPQVPKRPHHRHHHHHQRRKTLVQDASHHALQPDTDPEHHQHKRRHHHQIKQVPKLRESKFWEKPKSKHHHRIQSHHIFHKIHKRRKNKLEKLLHVLNTMEKPPEDPKMLTVLHEYGLPDQTKLFDLLYVKEPQSSDFGDNMRMYISHVLQSSCLYNFYNCYSALPPSTPTIQTIRYKGVHPHPEEFISIERDKAARRRKALRSVEPHALNEEHVAHLKELAINQLSSLPITVMHEILDEQIRVVEKMCYKYSDLAGSSSVTAKVATAHYNLMKKHMEALEFIGCLSLPPLSIYRKYEEPAKEENAHVTSSSSSENEDELEAFIKQDFGPTGEEVAALKLEEEENLILQRAVDIHNAHEGIK